MCSIYWALFETVQETEREDERICPMCKKEGEDEKHFIISYTFYKEKRKSLFQFLGKEIKFPIEKMRTKGLFLPLLNPSSNNAQVQKTKIIAKYRYDCDEIVKNKVKFFS